MLEILQKRFEKNMNRHQNCNFEQISKKISENPNILKILEKMEETGGEPDVIFFDEKTKEIWFADCSEESPK